MSNARAAIYARVSTKKEEQATSIGSQLSSCTQRCEREGWEIIAAEQDRLTGFRRGSMERRGGWQRITNLMQARAINVLVVWHRDRIGRDRREYDDFRDEVLEKYGVRIIPLMGIEEDPKILQTRWMAEDEMTQAQRFSELISWKTRMGRHRRIEAGYWPNTPPYGTMKDPHQKGVPIKNPDEWPALERMFELAAHGLSYGRIRHTLNAEGYPTRNGGTWCYSSIYEILSKEFFIGENWHDGEVHELKHQCLVDRDIWKGAQGEYRQARQKPFRIYADYCYLMPRVVCSHYRIIHPLRTAGDSLHLVGKYCRGRGGVKYPYYYRADRLRGSGGVQAEPVDGIPLRGKEAIRATVSAPELDQIVVERLIHNSRNNTLLTINIRDSLDNAAEGLDKQSASLSRRISRAHRDYDKLQPAMVRAAADMEQWGELLKALIVQGQKYSDRITNYEQELARVQFERRALNDTVATVERTVEQVHLVKALWENSEFAALREVLLLILDRVDLRLDHPKYYIKPVLSFKHAAPPLGIDGELLPDLRKLLIRVA